MHPNSDLNWCWLVIPFATNLDFSKSAVTWKRKLKNIFSGLQAKWNKFLSLLIVLTVVALFVVVIFWYILRKIKKIKQTRVNKLTIWGPNCCYSLKVRSKLQDQGQALIWITNFNRSLICIVIFVTLVNDVQSLTYATKSSN